MVTKSCSAISGDRPIYETIRPNLQDQHLAMANQFEGMSGKPFSEMNQDILFLTDMGCHCNPRFSHIIKEKIAETING